MSKIKQLQSDIELVHTLKFIAQAFEEISVMRMKRVRQSVLNSREFVRELSEVFFDVKASYKDEIKRLLIERKLANYKTAGKKLTVFVSANNKLYGEIIQTVFNSFYEAVKHEETNILIIGRLGRELYEKKMDKKPYIYFEISDSQIFFQDITAIMYHLVQFDNIDVFYAHFENILNQNAVISNISGDQPFALEKEANIKDNAKFVFEPEIKEILNYFKTQVFVALFKQTIHEAHLAHFASRVNEMESALTHIETQSQILYSEQRKAKKLEEDKKSLERIAGRNMWFK